MTLENISESKEINISLDNILIDVFDEIEEYFQVRCQLDKCLSDGYIHMAKTRCITGVHSVSRLQYNLVEDSRAKYKVDLTQDETLKDKLLNHDGLVRNAKFIFKLSDLEIEELQEIIKEKLDMKGDNNIGNDLKQRKNIQIKNDEDKKNIDCIADNDSESKDSKTIPDNSNISTSSSFVRNPSPSNQPLNWFGILVPQSLRKSQHSFIRATSLACQLAEHQGNVVNLMDHYRSLKALKN